jgi:3-phenylpropionate/trans-cinnamate dioxygenase ferredoxin reductase subunit
MTLQLDRELIWLPGQYVRVSFDGYPPRDYSPTLPPYGTNDLSRLLLHIRRLPGGVVSGDLGREIRSGTRVSLKGPFGSDFYRPGTGRIILISSGTGFAPIWAIARASRFREPDRQMMVIAGARRETNLYMRRSMEWLEQTGVRHLILTCSGGQSLPDVRSGRPTSHTVVEHGNGLPGS